VLAALRDAYWFVSQSIILIIEDNINMDKSFKKDFIKGSAATSVATIIAMVFQFLGVLIITRQITKEEFGIYVLIIVISTFLDTVSSLALEQSLVKFISSAEDLERRSTLIPTLIIRIFLIVVAVILVILFGNSLMSLFSFTATEFLYVIIILFILSSFRGLFYNLLQGMGLFKRYASVQIITSILRVGLLLVIILINELSLINVLTVEMLVVAFTVLLQLALIPYKEVLHWDIKLKNINRILRFSIPLYFSGISYFVQTQVNIFIISAYLNPVSIANYDVSGKVPQASAKGFQSFIIVLYPNLSRLFSKGDRESALTIMNKSLFTFSIAINLLLLVSFLFNKEIILLLFSDKYLDASLAFSYMMVAFYLSSMSIIMGYSLVSAGLPSITLKVNIAAGAINLIGAFIMIPLWGFMGAVYSIVLTSFSSLLFHYLYLTKYKMKIELISFAKPSLITIVVLILYYQFIPDNLIFKNILSIVYLIAVYFLLPEAKEIFIQIARHLFKFNSKNSSEKIL
jgi:O-antigen/teichoic acid export membrane protein